MISSKVGFQTERLSIRQGRAEKAADLSFVVARILTPATTEFLPSEWHGYYTPERAEAWIREQKAEGSVLLIDTVKAGEPIGLLVLGDVDLGSDRVEVRVGYVIAEEFWGRGFASELVGGLVRWCQDRTDVASIVGGVANKHPASARVLSKNGFVADSMTENETLYRLRITG